MLGADLARVGQQTLAEAIEPALFPAERRQKRLELAHDLGFAEHRRLKAAEDFEQEPIRLALDQRPGAGVRIDDVADVVTKGHLAETGPPDGRAGFNLQRPRLTVHDGERHDTLIVKGSRKRTVTVLSEGRRGSICGKLERSL